MYYIFSVPLCSIPSCGAVVIHPVPTWPASAEISEPRSRGMHTAPSSHRHPPKSGTHVGNKACKKHNTGGHTPHTHTYHRHAHPTQPASVGGAQLPLLQHRSLCPMQSLRPFPHPPTHNPHHAQPVQPSSHSSTRPNTGSHTLPSNAHPCSQSAAAERAQRGIENC